MRAPADLRPEGLQGKQRLPEGGADASAGLPVGRGKSKVGNAGGVHGSTVNKSIEQRQARQSHAILRSALDLGLVERCHARVGDRLVFAQIGQGVRCVGIVRRRRLRRLGRLQFRAQAVDLVAAGLHLGAHCLQRRGQLLDFLLQFLHVGGRGGRLLCHQRRSPKEEVPGERYRLGS